MRPRAVFQRSPLPQGVFQTRAVASARVVERHESSTGFSALERRCEDVFVASADDIAGMTSAQIAQGFALYNDAGRLRSGPVTIFEFDTPAGTHRPARGANACCL